MTVWTREAIEEFTGPIAFRLEHVGVDPVLGRRLARLKIPIGLVERLYVQKVPWDLVRTVLDTTGLRTPDDVRGLIGLCNANVPNREITSWARLGSLEATFRLTSTGISVETAASFPLSDHGLADVLKMYQAAKAHGLHHDDVPLWFAGNVLSLSAPYLDEQHFGSWRRVAVHQVGWRRAALACAAGLTALEAVAQVQDGGFDENGLRMLASLRYSGQAS